MAGKKGKIPPQFLKHVKGKKKNNGDKDKDVKSMNSHDKMMMHGMTGKKEYSGY